MPNDPTLDSPEVREAMAKLAASIARVAADPNIKPVAMLEITKEMEAEQRKKQEEEAFDNAQRVVAEVNEETEKKSP